MIKPYFKTVPGAPPPLTASVERRVRFEEVDALGIVWHGRYVSYFEDARVALGRRYGINYMDFYDAGFVTPLKRLELDYVAPLHFEECIRIEGRLHYTEAARINFDYSIYSPAGEVAARGASVQLMLDKSGELLMSPPPFFAAFLDRWRRGEFA